jgi:hypothetical protein
LSKRYGNLKNGVADIKEHKFFQNFEWAKLLLNQIKPYYLPNVKYNINSGDKETQASMASILIPLKRALLYLQKKTLFWIGNQIL